MIGNNDIQTLPSHEEIIQSVPASILQSMTGISNQTFANIKNNVSGLTNRTKEALSMAMQNHDFKRQILFILSNRDKKFSVRDINKSLNLSIVKDNKPLVPINGNVVTKDPEGESKTLFKNRTVRAVRLNLEMDLDKDDPRMPVTTNNGRSFSVTFPHNKQFLIKTATFLKQNNYVYHVIDNENRIEIDYKEPIVNTKEKGEVNIQIDKLTSEIAKLSNLVTQIERSGEDKKREIANTIYDLLYASDKVIVDKNNAFTMESMSIKPIPFDKEEFINLIITEIKL
jgi:hypothetical protein